HADCQTCHGKSQAGVIDNSAAGGDAYQASYHMDGKIEMNGISTPNNNQSAEYVAAGTGAYGCAKACHANNTAHQLSDSGFSVQLHEYGGGDCNGCHETGSNGAPKVTSAGSHSENATGYTCVQCHGAHNAGTVEVPNNPTVGINYSANGETGIALGGTATSGSTEAEICWNCHQLGSTDWRKGGDFNGYTISSRNWTTASFQPPGNVLPNRPVASIHSVNAGAENSSVGNNVNGSGLISISSMETAGNIRCSYCHDVHDLNLASSDNKSGKPYLRGTWLSNPYPLERPPQSGDNYNGNVWSGQPQDNPVPRLFASQSTQTGGFFIDQNSGWPMNGKTLSGTAGLCTMCHGTNVNSMDYYSGSKLWVGTNGHSNSTIGGTGTKKSNLFDARRINTGASQLNMGMQNQMVSFSSGSQWGDNSQPTWKPKDYMPSSNSIENVKPAENGYAPPDNSGWYGGTEGSHSRGGQYSTWYSNGGIGTNGGSSGRAHDFSCSKCHSPHASGLPALLITNCLDYKTVKNSGNGWSTTMRSRKQGTYTMGPKATNSIATELMGNCHRNESQASGWNRLAPDQ
ncbi:MAG: hypothetical protein L3J63_05965, partial [Geopsychrobacter sp.]|nr:hypothetical protein [Geopsychrobacter sp.]